jgi:lysophospholipase L1-like esterase
MIRQVIRKILHPVFLSILFTITASAQDPILILPLGNSLTYDARSLDARPTGDKISYRYKLFTLLQDGGYSFDFIGSYRSGYNYFNDCDNSGFSGIDTKNLADLVQTGTSAFTGKVVNGPYLNYYPADIILLEIGTNDVEAGKTSVSEVSRLLDAVDLYEQQSGKPILVIIGTIISEKNYPCGTHPGTATYNQNLKTMVQNRISNGDKLVLSDLECGAGMDYFNNMWDDFHPNTVGYDKMGQKLYSTIEGISQKPVVFNIPDQSVPEGFSFYTISLDNYVEDPDDPDNKIKWTTKPANPLHFNVSISSSRVATITPKDSEWNGNETITFIATDSGKYIPKLRQSDSDSAMFIVTPINDAPVIVSQISAISVNEDSSIEILKSNLNITDVDDPLAGLNLFVLPGNDYSSVGNTIYPGQDFNGTLTVNVQVTDGKALSNIFGATVGVIAINDPPKITSTPLTTADDYQYYHYTFSAHDTDSQHYTYSAVTIPSWAQFNAITGELYGTPKHNNVGSSPVKLKASDGFNDSFQEFTIIVTDNNDNPVFTSVPETTVVEGSEYVYILAATDIDENDVLVFSMLEKPSWMLFNPETKTLTGQPGNSDIGNFEIIAQVTDGRDIVEQNFNLSVKLFNGTNSEIMDQSGLIVYPNPAIDLIKIVSKDSYINGIELYDISGSISFTIAAAKHVQETEINISDLPAGVYLLKVSTQKGLLYKKLVIER